MVVAACSRIDQDGQPAAATWRFYQGLAEIEPGDHDTRSWIRAVTASGQPPWNIGSIAFNGSIVKSLGGFLDPSAGPASDIELVLRMAIGGTVRYVDKRVLVYTQRTDSDHRLQQRQIVSPTMRTRCCHARSEPVSLTLNDGGVDLMHKSAAGSRTPSPDRFCSGRATTVCCLAGWGAGGHGTTSDGHGTPAMRRCSRPVSC